MGGALTQPVAGFQVVSPRFRGQVGVQGTWRQRPRGREAGLNQPRAAMAGPAQASTWQFWESFSPQRILL